MRSPSRNRRTTTIGLVTMGVLAAGLAVLAVRAAHRGGDEPRSSAAAGANGGPLGGAGAAGESEEVLALPLSAPTAAAVRQVVRATRGASGADAARLRSLALEAGDPLVAGNAIRALCRLGVFAGDGELLRLLDDPRPRVRQESVLALSDSAGPEHVDRLVRRLGDEDAHVRALALRALGGIDDARAESAVAGALARPASSAADRAMAASRRVEAGAGGGTAVRRVRTGR